MWKTVAGSLILKTVWKMLVLVAAAGVVGACAMTKEAREEKDEGTEIKVTLDKVPAPARATLEKESQGATIKEVDQKNKDGKTVYEADAMIGGTNYEIVVAADGALVSKKVDNEEGAKGEDREQRGEHKD